jgi:signal transduction histidine kinase
LGAATRVAGLHYEVPMSAGDPNDPPDKGDDLAALIRGMDWSKTPIGPVEGWSPTLGMIVDLLLANRFPHLLWWGPEYVSIYNDAYIPVLGAKHPWALGRPFREVWSEIDEFLRPLIDTPFKGGPPTWMDDLELEINRHGYFEETHFTVAYSPVPDPTAPRGIGGVLATVVEITDKIVGERRIAVLRDLGVRAGEGRTADEACALAALALRGHDKDIPFALIYLLDEEGQAYLAAATGVSETAAPAADWPFAEVLASSMPVTVEGLGALGWSIPAGPWSDPADAAVILPVRSSTGQPLAGFVVAGVSARLRLDERYRSFLDLVAAQIAAAVANARAYDEERKRAEALAEIDRAKTLFFSNVSHEFRTPLTLIMGPLADAIERGEGLDPARLDLVHRNSLRLFKLVNSLLDFSRIEAGRARAVIDPTDLAQLTADLASNFRSACERAGLSLAVDCPPLSAPVPVDRDMWEKIVLNLLSNAFKFTFEGGIEVGLREAEGFAELTVRDTGVGVPEAEMAHLFERFHRIEGQRSRTHEGSGIGLALVSELVRLHGGTIAVESGVGRGTVFAVRLPMVAPQRAGARDDGEAASTLLRADAFVQEALRGLPDADEPDLMPLDAAGLPILPGGGRVLVADDNADMRDYIRRLLRATGCEVRTVAEGRAALASLHEERPDLVLADVMMPEMDGFALLREIRGDPALREVPVILLSARAGEESRVEGLTGGADDYLVKPFSARELIARVGANLELARVRSEANAALRALNETLEQRVAIEIAEREKTEMALRQSQKMEAIGQLTGGIAHDFNNLLAAVGGSLSIVERRLADGRPGAERYIRAGQEAVRRAATLTQRLLAFSRQQNLDARPVDANKLIAGMEVLVRRTVGPNVEVEIVGAAGLWPSKVDAAQLESSLLNLCINARDAMAPDGGRLTIVTANLWLDDRAARERDLASGQYIVISVTDTGSGMTADVIERAFDPFFTTKPVGQGTGLGLSMVYGFVRQSGGQVRIYSELGKGTTMRLYLSRYAGAVEGGADADSASCVEQGDGETVLVVDDEPTLVMLITDVLEEQGYKVLSAKTGAAALGPLQSGLPIDLLVTDVGLPGGMNGRQLAEAARELRPELKVLFVTGFAENAAVGQGRLDPGMDLLSKPFEIATLAAKVRALIEG